MADEKNSIPDHGGDEKTVLTIPDDKEADGTAVMDGGPDLDSSKVKFINANGADASVNLGKPSTEFVGLTKEELMKYATDPYWVRVRLALLITFWVAWFAMLAAAIVIIVLAPKCPPRPNLEWWQKSVIYQAYPKSLQDSNGDGVGDLKGIEDRLSYMRSTLNVTAVWINPIYPSGNMDGGYDVKSYLEIDPEFGTMEEFRSMLHAMHRKGIKLILDFVPNHSSKDHPWFQKSRMGVEFFRDYYVWHPGKTNPNGGRNLPPNNWLSVFNGSAWEWDDVRNEYYLHQFLAEQPDLNYRNPTVREEMKGVLDFWLSEGVDGFRVDAAAHLFEGNITMDEPVKDPSKNENDPDRLDHKYTQFQPETYELITEWREVLERHTESSEKYRFMVVEVYGTVNETLGFYEYNGKKGADMPSNMALVSLGKDGDCGGKCVYDKVFSWLGNLPNDKWSNWVTGNHDNSRVSTRMGEDMVNAVNMLLLTLPGTPTTYYGEEIGMSDTVIPPGREQDPVGFRKGKEYSRDPERTPMQWSPEENAGFSTGNSTWLPVNENYRSRNVRVQLAHGSGVSNVEVYQSLTLLRQQPSFQWGILHKVLKNDNVFCFVRQAEGFPGYLVAINFGPNNDVLDFHAARPDMIPREGKIAGHTHNFGTASKEFTVGTAAPLDRIHLKRGQGVVFQWEWEAQKA